MYQQSLINLENYNVLEPISDGSYADVFKIQHKITNQKFALKVLLIKYLKKESKQHQAYLEKQILSVLNHKGIIKIHDYIRDSQNLYMVLDYCPKGDMFNLMKNMKQRLKIAPNRNNYIKYYISQIVQTIHYLHKNGVIHRDLKPQNIVLTQNQKIKIIDFGTCKVKPENSLLNPKIFQTLIKIKQKYYVQRNSFEGSPNYISPEAIKGIVNYSNDIWSLGVIIYKFYYNVFPFVGSNTFQILNQIKSKQIDLQNQNDTSLKNLIKGLLNKDQKQRPTIDQVKKMEYFKHINFQEIFELNVPNMDQQLIVLRQILLKKMFFGNYKKRQLIISKGKQGLYFQYKLIQKIKFKRRLALNKFDVCQKLGKYQFYIKVYNKKYYFKTIQNQCDQIVNQINHQLQQYYKI